MKRSIYLMSAGLAMASPAMAADPVVADDASYGLVADFWGGYYFLGNSTGGADDDGLDEGFVSLGGSASMLFGFGGDFAFQLSGEGLSNFLSTGEADDDQMAAGGQLAAHLIHGSGLGVFGGGGVVGYQDEDSNNFYFVGGEYTHAFGSFDALLQGGYLGASVTDDTIMWTFEGAWFARIAPSFAFGDGFELGINVAYVAGDLGDIEDGSFSLDRGDAYLWDAGASLAYDLKSAPVSMYIAYQGLFFNSDEFIIEDDIVTGGSFDEHLIKAGVRMSLGGLAGSEIDTPDVYRWVGAGQRSD